MLTVPDHNSEELPLARKQNTHLTANPHSLTPHTNPNSKTPNPLRKITQTAQLALPAAHPKITIPTPSHKPVSPVIPTNDRKIHLPKP